MRHSKIQVQNRAVYDFIVIVFGLFFVWAGVYKAVWPDDAVRFAGVFFDSHRSDLIVKAASVVELAIGSALLLNLYSRVMVMLVIGLMVIFSTGLVYAKRAGYVGTCGCAGVGTTLDHALVRNAILAFVACATVWIPSSHKSE
jgi:hypothetical protein